MRCTLLALLCVACAATQQTAIQPKKTETDKEAQRPETSTQRPLHKQIAITIDDLPWVGELAPNDTRSGATKRLLQTLQDHHVPAFGFVTCKNISPTTRREGLDSLRSSIG